MITEFTAGMQVQLLLPIPGMGCFDYRVPEDMTLELGDVVQVSFRNRQIIGIVWGEASGNIDPAKLKDIAQRIDIAGLAEHLRQFVERVADYTLSPLGSVLKMVISVPAALQPRESLPYYLPVLQEGVRITPQRQRVMALFEDHRPRQLKTIAGEAVVSMAVVVALREAGALREAVPSAPSPPAITLPALSPLQEEAAECLRQKISAGGYQVTLLDGVTGSGKTEVYFTAIAELLTTTSGQVLILLPEIVLTSQLLKRFQERFGFMPAEWHSGMSIKQKKMVWQGVASGEVRLIIGARSSLFLPFAKLALIIVDEEHEGAFKQEEGVLYHARDMAVMRAYLQQLPIILASATPSLETLLNCESGKFSRLHLPTRHGTAGMAEMTIVDMREEKLPRNRFISAPLKKALIDTLKQGQQSMLFLNRRGYAPLTLCRSCGHRLTCPHCSSCLVEHRKQGRLMCHHCGYHMMRPHNCPSCQEQDSFVPCGPGVERVAEEVAALLPEARMALMTKDTIADSSAAEAIVSDILARKLDIIIGTQMIAKGHHFPGLTLVGIVDADLGLAGGDLRAAERTYQLLHQVSGRAGRESIKGRVILQSYMPENAIIQALVTEQRDSFMQMESYNRKECGMPPFTRLAAIILSGPDEVEVAAAAKLLARLAPTDPAVMVLGPAPALLYQLRGKYRFRLLVKAERSINIQKYVRYFVSLMKLPSAVKLRVDIDPYSFF